MTQVFIPMNNATNGYSGTDAIVMLQNTAISNSSLATAGVGTSLVTRHTSNIYLHPSYTSKDELHFVPEHTLGCLLMMLAIGVGLSSYVASGLRPVSSVP